MNAQLLVQRIKDTAKLRPAGYVEEVLAAGVVVLVGGREVLNLPQSELDRLREKYRNHPKPPPYEPLESAVASLSAQRGPGTELKALLKKVGIVASPGCSCNKRAMLMDENEAKEPGWCEKNLETICDWLQEEATKRKLPFVRMAAKILVRQAIRNARKKGQ